MLVSGREAPILASPTRLTRIFSSWHHAYGVVGYATALLRGEKPLCGLVRGLSARRVLLEHAHERHRLRMDRFEHWLQVLRSCRLEVLLEQFLVLVVQGLVLLSVVLDLTLKLQNLLV